MFEACGAAGVQIGVFGMQKGILEGFCSCGMRASLKKLRIYECIHGSMQLKHVDYNHFMGFCRRLSP